MSPYLACSQTQRKGVVVGEEEIYISRELANVLEKSKKKNKTKSVYRLLHI